MTQRDGGPASEAVCVGSGSGLSLLRECAEACISNGGAWYSPQQMASILSANVGMPAMLSDASFIGMSSPENVSRIFEIADALVAALQMVMTMDVKGHQLQDRLQFSDPGRAILSQVNAALADAMLAQRDKT